MGNNLSGDDARIWGLHSQGFSVVRISGLVGLSDDYVRSVIARVWLDDKLSGRRAQKG